MYETFLQKIPLFAELPADDLSHLCEMIVEVRLAAGETLFNEGDVADMAYITYEGELEVTKLVDGREIRLDLHREPGIVIGESALLEESMRLATIRATKPSFVLGLSRYQVQELLNISPTAAQILLKTLTNRSRNIEALVQHDERMAQIGTVTAGLAHELNNPAAAVSRSANQLETAMQRAEAALLALERLDFTAEQRQTVETLTRRVKEIAANPPQLDPLDRSDMEEKFEAWLEEIGVENGWELIDSLVNLGLEPVTLVNEAADFSTEQLAALACRLAALYTSQSLLLEMAQGAGRIADIVKAMKSYVFLDQAPVQNVDVNAGLADTLVVLKSQFETGVRIRREFTADLPQITAYGSDLNQVWTELIKNAVEALAGQGEIVIRTGQTGKFVVVAIEDNGPGIAPQNISKVFGPFFTTKPPGMGKGVGLTVAYNIVTNHHGNIEVHSEPGRTVFEVWLPVSDVS